jgi:hypothetical protein
MSALPADVVELAIRLAADLVCMTILVRGIYLRYHAAAEFAFAHMMLNLVTFALVWLMHGAEFGIGVGLGLFAIFGILRYRTQALKIVDLTYLFMAIGLALINGIQNEGIHIGEIVLLDLVILALPAFMEWRAAARGEQTMTMLYDRVDLLAPAQRDELVGDIRTRLGVDCLKLSVGEVDLLRETVQLTLLVRTRES